MISDHLFIYTQVQQCFHFQQYDTKKTEVMHQPAPCKAYMKQSITVGAGRSLFFYAQSTVSVLSIRNTIIIHLILNQSFHHSRQFVVFVWRGLGE